MVAEKGGLEVQVRPGLAWFLLGWEEGGDHRISDEGGESRVNDQRRISTSSS